MFSLGHDPRWLPVAVLLALLLASTVTIAPDPAPKVTRAEVRAVEVMIMNGAIHTLRRL